MPSPETPRPGVSVIVPARNEAACLGACLESLVAQSGVDFEILVVDDGSTDGTRQIAQSFPGVRVVDPDLLPAGWSGKNNALVAGARLARGDWLLFTDADTVHAPGSLARAREEAERHGVALLSYSPRQIVAGLWANAVMPVIFAELASTYRFSETSDPGDPVAAANGQYLLVSRASYDAVGGHAAVATSLLEDVSLARAVRQSGERIRFRFEAGDVRTQMYRSFAELRDGWTKNLALLFASPVRLAMWRALEFLAIVGGIAVAVGAGARGSTGLGAVAVLVAVVSWALCLRRIRRARFGPAATLASVLGLPVFAYFLLRSWRRHQTGRVMWKGRTY